MLFCIQNDPLILRAVGNNNSMLRSKFLCYLQMPGGAGTLLTVKYPAPRTHRVSNVPGLSWGDARVWNSLVHYLYHNLLETRMYGITSANKGILFCIIILDSTSLSLSYSKTVLFSVTN